MKYRSNQFGYPAKIYVISTEGEQYSRKQQLHQTTKRLEEVLRTNQKEKIENCSICLAGNIHI